MSITSEKNILLISADKDLTLVLKKYASLIGYNVVHYDSGSSGLQYAKSNRNYLLVLISQDVPDIAGYKVISIMRKQNINCPMILLTEKINPVDYRSFIKYGADTIFSAPINFGKLLLEIDNAIKRFEPEMEVDYSDIDFPEISMSAKFHFTIRDISETGCRFYSHFCMELNSVIILSAPEVSDKLALPLDTIYPVRIMNCNPAQNGKGYDLGGVFVALQEKVYSRLHHACRSVKGFKFTTFN